ncbi:hypothetical protein CCACVL1_15094 [Corchorus capsularis]|uniref:Uncharacterized protein n=1 Tax=Corchorus capsularis TaxID=210143 RepID=A0A1R3I447_COCAP|nr:hypothetical protein CCACVL1_15094 [Corchorus capsularis]
MTADIIGLSNLRVGMTVILKKCVCSATTRVILGSNEGASENSSVTGDISGKVGANGTTGGGGAGRGFAAIEHGSGGGSGAGAGDHGGTDIFVVNQPGGSYGSTENGGDWRPKCDCKCKGCTKCDCNDNCPKCTNCCDDCPKS